MATIFGDVLVPELPLFSGVSLLSDSDTLLMG